MGTCFIESTQEISHCPHCGELLVYEGSDPTGPEMYSCSKCSTWIEYRNPKHT